jgi:hypothetical protein
MEILDARGKILERLSNSRAEAGWHPIAVNGIFDKGKSMGSGVLFVRLDADGGHLVKQVLWAR